jgi:hypothetical protein
MHLICGCLEDAAQVNFRQVFNRMYLNRSDPGPLGHNYHLSLSYVPIVPKRPSVPDLRATQYHFNWEDVILLLDLLTSYMTPPPSLGDKLTCRRGRSLVCCSRGRARRSRRSSHTDRPSPHLQ